METQSAHITTGERIAGSPMQRVARLFGSNRAVSMVAHARRGKLDRALTETANPPASRLVAARAAQLSRASTRSLIADGLERMARSPDGPPSRFRIEPSRPAIFHSRSELLKIADTLRGDHALSVAGIAMLDIILTDGTGPAYTDRRGNALALELKLARARLIR